MATADLLPYAWTSEHNLNTLGSMETSTVGFSELLRDPRRVTEKLDLVPALHVRRRDAEDLVITTAARDDRRQQGTTAVTRLLGSLIRHAEGRQAILAALPEVYPWVRFLPPDEAEQFAGELMPTIEACAAVDAYDELHQLSMVWRKTAAIWADPELARHLAEPLAGEDHGEVRLPE